MATLSSSWLAMARMDACSCSGTARERKGSKREVEGEQERELESVEMGGRKALLIIQLGRDMSGENLTIEKKTMHLSLSQGSTDLWRAQ